MSFRVLRSAAREFGDVLRAATATHRRLQDELVATVGVDLLRAIAAFLLEHHSQQTDIKTSGSAAFWTTTPMPTVSSQVKNPISLGGRILDVFMEIYAITVIATLAGSAASCKSADKRLTISADGRRSRRRSLTGSLRWFHPLRRSRRP
jgi:hypothetical protein